MLRQTLAMFAVLCVLSGCDSTGALRELRSAKPLGDAYQTALAGAYQDFADQKEAAYDWWTSKYFADKGLMAAYGRDIEPETPAHWEIPASLAPEFEDARTKLIEAVAANRSTQPEMAASAVVAYDRWLELAHHGWNDAAIEEQRDALFAILAILAQAHVDSSTDAAESIVESTSTILYFPLNSDVLGDSAQAALKQLVEYIQSSGNVSVHINGHADRAGGEPYNLTLSQRRAKMVLAALTTAGVNEKLMQYFAFGETDPAIPTADGEKEPKNRRVEIYFE